MKSNLNLKDIFNDIANEIKIKNGTDKSITPENIANEIHYIHKFSDINEKELRRIGYSNEDINLILQNQIKILNKNILDDLKKNKENRHNFQLSWDPNTTSGPTKNGNWYQSSPTNLGRYFPKIDISHLLNASYFLSSLDIKTIPLLDTSNVTDMSHMFEYCDKLIYIPLINTKNVITMSNMFHSCHSLINIPKLDMYNVLNTTNLFYACYCLNTIPKFNTHNVIDMSGMFSECASLKSIPQLDTSNCKHMENIFHNCKSLKTIPLFNTSNVYDMSGMFARCSKLLEIPSLDCSKVVSFNGYDSCFADCRSLKKIHLKNINADLDLAWTDYYQVTAGNCPLDHDALMEIVSNLVPFDSKRMVASKGFKISKIIDKKNILNAFISIPCILTTEEISNRLKALPAFFKLNEFSSSTYPITVIDKLNPVCICDYDYYDEIKIKDSPHTITLGSTLKSKLSSDEIQLIKNKGWKVLPE